MPVTDGCRRDHASHSWPTALDSTSGMLTAFAEPPPVKPGPRGLARAMPSRTTLATPQSCIRTDRVCQYETEINSH